MNFENSGHKQIGMSYDSPPNPFIVPDL